MTKKYVALITADYYSKDPTLRTRTYLIPITFNEAKGEVINISNSEKIWTECGKQKIDLSIENICRLILARIPKDEISKIVVEPFGVGLAIYDEICQIVQEEGLDIFVEEIRNIRHI